MIHSLKNGETQRKMVDVKTKSEVTFVIYFSAVDLEDVFFDELVSPFDVGKLPPSAFFGNNIYTKRLLEFNFELILQQSFTC